MPNWYPGQVAVGQKVFADVVGMARGMWTQPPVVTTPATVASGTAVVNTTGLDVNIYASATTGITKAVLGSGGTAPGSITPATTADYYLPAGQSIALTYSGTLTWLWLAV